MLILGYSCIGGPIIICCLNICVTQACFFFYFYFIAFWWFLMKKFDIPYLIGNIYKVLEGENSFICGAWILTMLFVRRSCQHLHVLVHYLPLQQANVGSNLIAWAWYFIKSCIATSIHRFIPEFDNVKDVMKTINAEFEP